MKSNLKPKDDGWVCTKCKAKLPTATDALNHRCGVVVVPLSAVLALLDAKIEEAELWGFLKVEDTLRELRAEIEGLK